MVLLDEGDYARVRPAFEGLRYNLVLERGAQGLAAVLYVWRLKGRLEMGDARRLPDAAHRLGNVQDVAGWVRSFWTSYHDFVERGSGFCLIERAPETPRDRGYEQDRERRPRDGG